jgi:hypothetical protein
MFHLLDIIGTIAFVKGIDRHEQKMDGLAYL